MDYSDAFLTLAPIEAEIEKLDHEYEVELDAVKSPIDKKYEEKTSGIRSKIKSDPDIIKFSKALRNSRDYMHDSLDTGYGWLSRIIFATMTAYFLDEAVRSNFNFSTQQFQMLFGALGAGALVYDVYKLGKSYSTIRKIEKISGGKEKLRKIEILLDRFV